MTPKRVPPFSKVARKQKSEAGVDGALYVYMYSTASHDKDALY